MPNYLSSNGTPADNVGVTGDFSLDYANKFLWGPKPSDTSWAGSAKSIVGPTGPAGAAPILPVMANVGSAYGPGVQFAGQTMGTTTGAANSIFNFTGTTIPNTFTPQTASALTGLQVTNFGGTGATVYFYLRNLTTGADIFGYNGGNGIASGTVTAQSFANSTYPLVAGNTYQWQGIRGSAGATTMQINPIYIVPSGTASAVSFYQPFTTSGTVNLASNSSANTLTPGTSQQGYYRNAAQSYLYTIEYWIAGSGKVAPFLSNTASGANHFTVDNYGGAPTLTSTLTRYTVGPFPATAWPFAANTTYVMNLYAYGVASTVTQFYSQITVGM